MSIPSDLRYTADHEWIRIDSEVATIGITEFAATALGDVVFVLVPGIGSRLIAGQICGEIESTKAVSDVVSPVTGFVVEVNEVLTDRPDALNTDPYGDGWLFRAELSEPVTALDVAAYRALTGAK